MLKSCLRLGYFCQTWSCINTVLNNLEQTPEKAWWFLVVLDSVGEGAELDRQRRSANITIMENDYPYGLVQFDPSSR